MILVDTNVLARSLQIGHIHYQAAIDSMAQLRHEDVLAASPQVLIELYATCTRTQNGLGLTPDQALHEIKLIERDYPILPESAEVFVHWELLAAKYQPRNKLVFDMRHVAFMLAHQISRILTFNDRDFAQFSEIQVFNPFDVLGIPRV